MNFRSASRPAADPGAAPSGRLAGAAVVLRRPTALVVQALLLLGLLAATAGWVLAGKTVALAVDGDVRQVGFRGQTVADVLAAADLRLGERDSVVPSPSTEVQDGDRVVVRRGRPITLNLDGRQRTVWVTALSVDEALQQLDLRAAGLAVSASRSRAIPLRGLALDVRTPKGLSVTVDGATRAITSTAPTVGAALAQAGIAVGAEDRVAPLATDVLLDRTTVVVQRVRTETGTAEVAVPFRTDKRDDPNLTKGTTRQLQAGAPGLVRRVTRVTYVDGRVESRTVVGEEQLAAPTPRILAVGTKAAPRPPASSSAGPRQSTGGADSLNWPALARCESGGNPRAVSANGMYYGLYQFSLSTWRGVGGSGRPSDAAPDEQTYRAKLLYNRSGAGQWPTCGRNLFT